MVSHVRQGGITEEGKREVSYNDHSIEDLLSKDAIPWYSLADVELIFRISRLQA
jgi:hypothetical protein